MAEHVTFFRMKVQSGKVDEMKQLVSDRGAENQRQASAGWQSTVVGQSKADPNSFWGAVTWDTTARYQANADSPEQNEWFQKMRALLESDPEWFDCDVLEDARA